VLPRIRTSPKSSAIPLPAHTLPFYSPSKGVSNATPPTASLLNPPPAVGVKPRSAADTILEIIIGQPRVLSFPDVPQRIALTVDEKDPVATLKEVPHKDHQWYLIGKKPGTAFLDVWLPDTTNATLYRIVHYVIRVLPNPADKQEVETIYDTLEREINRTFPGSNVHLKRAGDTLVVSGNARNIFDATHILDIARQNAPGAQPGRPAPKTNEPNPVASPSLQATLDNYAHAGGPRVINLLRIPGEQQIMLRIVVAEVNRSAARSLGLDFGIGDKQATIFSNRAGAKEGSSTLVDNGWIAQALRSLQDLHYAQSLAEPTLTTVNGQTARFQVGGEFAVPVVSPSASGAVQGVAFRSYGVKLSVQPVVADTDRIRLMVQADVSGMDPRTAAQVGAAAIPGLKVRNFESTVELREGETLAVAGLIRGSQGQPPRNAGFVSADNPPSDQELVVLISPLLIRPSTPDYRAGSPVASPFNAADIELYLRSRKTLLPQGDALYLIGPQGYAGDARHGATRR